MPDKVVQEVQKTWSSEIRDEAGKPLFTPTN
jgi:hypothetical protein